MNFTSKHVDFVFESNRIDWNTVSPDVLTREVVERASKGDQSPEVPQEIRDHFEALRLMFEMVKEPQGRSIGKVVIALHYALTKNILPINEAGKFRNWGVWIGAEIAPRYTLIPKYMERLEGIFETTYGEDLCWRVHNEFECIHPFSDGNGRTGRLLLNYCFVRFMGQFKVIPYDDREAYYNRIQEYRRTQFQPITEPDPQAA